MRLLGRRANPRPGQDVTIALPVRCGGLGAAFIDGEYVTDAVRATAHEYADDFLDLETFLDDLDRTVRAVRGEAASAELVRVAALCWIDRFQRDFNFLTCEDPLTGMHTIHHVQSSLAQLYAAGGWWLGESQYPATDFVFVVIELEPRVAADAISGLAVFEHKLRLAAAAEMITEHLPDAAPPASLSTTRILVVARRTAELADRLMSLQTALDARLGLTPRRGHCRVWMEALPATLGPARLLLDELAR